MDLASTGGNFPFAFRGVRRRVGGFDCIAVHGGYVRTEFIGEKGASSVLRRTTSVFAKRQCASLRDLLEHGTKAYFSSFVRKLPISYTTFAYRRSEFADLDKLTERMRRDISEVLLNHLGFFQSFDDVKVYYDNGQDIVKRALDRSISKILSKGVVQRRKTSMTDYRLEQVADYLCTIELALVKYEAKEDGETYNKFFGGVDRFKKNWLKQARSKRMR